MGKTELKPEHFHQLNTGSSISQETIAERGYTSVENTSALTGLGFSLNQRRVPGLLIPIWGVDGTRVGLMYRPDQPRNNTKGKPVKYENPIGKSLRLDCPPRCQKLLGDPNIPLYVSEGIKKADALASRGVCVVGLPGGVWGFRGRNTSGGLTNLADWDSIALKDRTVYVIFDNDIARNPSVRKAALRLCGFLKLRGAKSEVIVLPTSDKKIGVDDYFASGGSIEGLSGMTVAAEDLKEDTESETIIHACYYIHEGRIYLQIRGGNGTYRFAYMDSADGSPSGGAVAGGSADSIKLVDTIHLSSRRTVKPIPLPEKDGRFIELVGMPDEGVIGVILMAPEELWVSIKGHIAKYCDLAELDLDLCALYILFTWFYPKVSTLGYLRFIADTGMGKSRCQKVVGDPCFYPLTASGASSFSGAARQQDRWRGTLIVDEADFSGDKETQLTKYINLGFEQGKYYILSDKQNPQKQEFFNPFCPKIFAMRQPFRDNATEGRLLSVSPHQTHNRSIPIILPAEYQAEVLQLRNTLAIFSMAHWSEVDGSKLMDFSDLGIEPRLRQLAMPLSIVFQLWPEGRGIFIDYLLRRQLEVRKTRSMSWEGALVNLVIAIATGEMCLSQDYPECYIGNDVWAITPTMVAKVMKSTQKAVSQSLASVGFDSEIRSKNLGGIHKHHRAYCINSNDTWLEITERYCEDPGNIELPPPLRSNKFSTGVQETVASVACVAEPVAAGRSGTHATDATLVDTPTENDEGDEREWEAL